MPKLFLILICLILVCPSFAAENKYNISVDNSPFIGPQNAPVTIIEFIDYQ